MVFGDALAYRDRSGRDRDALTGVGDTAGGMIGGRVGEPVAGEPMMLDPLGAVDGGFLTPDTHYPDTLSVTAAPTSRADVPPTPATPVEPAAPQGANPRPGPPGPPGRPLRQRPARAAGRGQGTARTGPVTRAASVARAAGRPSAMPPGTVPARASRSAPDLPSGQRRFGWVRGLFLALVLAVIVLANVVNACNSRLTGQVDPTHPAHVAAAARADVHHGAVTWRG